MNIKTLTFVKQGESPSRERKSKSQELVKAVLGKLAEMKPKQELNFTLEGKSFQQFMTKLRRAIDDNLYDVERIGATVVIKHKEIKDVKA